jgi:uncharacterized membrane protein
VFAALVISGGSSAWIAGAILLISIGVLAAGYLRGPAPRGVRIAGFCLKLLAVLALLVCLLEPSWTGQRAKPGANQFAIVADNSEGLQIHDPGADHTRGEDERALVTGKKSGWIGDLEANFQLRRYRFDTRLEATRDFAELRFDGRATALGAALRSLAERSKGQPLAGVLLLTDGIATDIDDALPDLTGLPPVYPVVIGADASPRDLAITKASVSLTAFEDAPVTIQTEVTADGFEGERIVAQLVDPNGKVVKEMGGTAKSTEPFSFRFEVKPEKPGISFYEIRVAPATASTNAASQEATLANNRRVVVVDRGRGPYRILYVSGRPNWEFKFMNRALAADTQVQLVGLIRLAKKERLGALDFRGREGETSNPLFRGFDKTNEDTERYDQPVLARFNTRDETELRAGFPKSAEDLFAYQAVILDDVEAGFFTRDQLALLQRFVTDRGGGFMMLGGQESFAEGGYDRTPVGDMLPVYLNRRVEPPSELAYKLDLTREGWLQPWARLRTAETDERGRLAEMPAFQVANLVGGTRPGASVLATVSDDSGRKLPALTAQRFGHGRVGALLIGDLWRWGLKDAKQHADMDKAWRQMIRWLVADVPRPVDFEARPRPEDGSTELTIRAHDRRFEPLDNATVAIEVEAVGGNTTNAPGPVRFNAEPVAAEAGVYRTRFTGREVSGYVASAVVTDAAGAEVGRAQAGWTSDTAAEEFRTLRPNRALLERIAKQTGGEVVSASGLAAFVRSLPDRRAPVTEAYTTPLWHTPLLFLFALACFGAEWALRRWKGLA